MLSEKIRSWRWWPLSIPALFMALILGLLSLPQPSDRLHHGDARQATNSSTEAQSRLEPADERVADYTAWLAVFTAVLAVVSGIQIFYLNKSDRRAAAAAEEASRQFKMMAIQADTLEKQKEIARTQFFADHRPRLILRDVFFSNPDDFSEVTFEISNVGESLARVVRSFVAVRFVADPRQFKDWSQGERGLLTNQTGFKAGQLRPFAVRTDRAVQAGMEFIRLALGDPVAVKAGRRYAGSRGPEGTLFFFGAIEYVDGRGEEFGTSHLAVFRRECEVPSGTFKRTGNPDHEYSD